MCVGPDEEWEDGSRPEGVYNAVRDSIWQLKRYAAEGAPHELRQWLHVRLRLAPNIQFRYSALSKLEEPSCSSSVWSLPYTGIGGNLEGLLTHQVREIRHSTLGCIDR